jgi:zinc protease
MSEPAVRFRALILAAAFSFLASCSVTEPDTLGSIFLPAPDDPLVHFRVLVKTGSVHDPSGKDGLCLMTWNLVANGATRTSTAAEIAARLHRLSAGISVTVDKEASIFSADIARENLNAFYAIFKEMLLSPGLQTDDLDLLKSDRVLRFEVPSDEEDVRAFSRDALDRLIYEGHPYGRPSSEAVGTISGITNIDARVFYAQHFVRGNIIVGLAGGYPPDFPDRVLTDFKLLPAGFTPALRLPVPKRPTGPEILIAEMPASLAAVAIGTAIDPDMTAEEAAALRIAAAYLGRGGEAGLIPDRFRRQKIFPVPLADGGGDDPVAAIPIALESFRAMVKDGIPDDRFELIRKSLFNETRLAAGKTGERLRERVAALAPAKGSDDVGHDLVVLVDLTKSEVDQAVRKYLDPGRIGIAIVTGDADTTRRALAAAVRGANIRVFPAKEIFKPAPRPKDKE